MDIIRRNTDYALRAMVNLANHWEKEPVSARQIACDEGISYQLTCKLMQKLHKAGLVESCMGPKGGFVLSTEPAKINLFQIIKAIQGPLEVNRCLLDIDICPRKPKCSLTGKLIKLQNYIEDYFDGITLEEVLMDAPLDEGKMV